MKISDVFILLMIISGFCFSCQESDPKKPEIVIVPEDNEVISISDEIMDDFPYDSAHFSIEVTHPRESTQEVSRSAPDKPKAKPKAFAKIKATEKEFNFGNIDEGDQVEHVFTISNAGKANLYIKNVDAACGCTLVDFPKSGIAPGKSASIKVHFDSEGKMGRQKKVVTLYTNARPKTIDLYMVGVVYPKVVVPDTLKDSSQ